jgi:hypothetical protein
MKKIVLLVAVLATAATVLLLDAPQPEMPGPHAASAEAKRPPAPAVPAPSAVQAAAPAPAAASAVTAASAVPAAGADEDPQTCSDRHPLCTCDGKPSDAQLTAPKGMKLVKIGGCIENNGAFLGQLFLEGEETVTGTLHYVDGGEMYGNMLTFEADGRSDEPSQYASAGTYFGFTGDEKFHPPAIKHENDCWAARATVRVRKIHVVDGGSDQDGVWATDFDVLQLGKYHKCEKSAGAPQP